MNEPNRIWEVTEKDDISITLCEESFRRARVKWDGCVDLVRASNGVDIDDPDSSDVVHLHICDLDYEIECLTSMRDEARKHFGPDWPNHNRQ